ncbi:PREDICTED: zinc finger BED domain-containing protein DAYSLEEPER-like [Camelina sativa]|uniref:Zinc finger BED domain-containing protein DAYSLEEPER-like n=1 Tax=Camelina sativa TaxID=90675 RepID=A0ABM0ZBZ9_CAMSA|nr:PREDICTED: zinc finger BED domain-containing protein DAYSLEEPER-like [Camelina sativa]
MAALNAEHEYHAMNEDGQEAETQGGAHSETQPTQETTTDQTVFNSNKRLKSDCWKEFIPVAGLETDGKHRGHCIHCNKKMIVETSQGTSSVKRHLAICPKRPPGVSEASEYDQKVDREMVTEIIVYHDMPFRYVEYEKVRARDKYLNPNCQPICRQTAGNDVFRRYELEKEKVKKIFAGFKRRVCCTADLWTARGTLTGYICLTAHYVDDEWRLNSKILAFCEMKPPHTGLSVATDLLKYIRESVRFVKFFTSRREAFAACIESVGIRSGAGLSLDVLTRWNSTYDMLARALKFRKAIVSLKECDRNYKSSPSKDEWDRGEKICDFLKPFSTITTYFSDYHSSYGSYLRSTVKVQILQSAFDKVDPSTSEEKVKVVVKNLENLYKEHREKVWTSSTFSTTQTPVDLLNESPLEDDPNYDVFELERSIQAGSDNTKSNLQNYLEDPRLDLRSFTDMEVLSYWKGNGQHYGDLASLACDVLSIPITTMAAESPFSIGGDIEENFDDGAECTTSVASSSGV